MTGLYPFHLGRQGEPIANTQPTGLTLDRKLMPEYLKEKGYSTHLVGKWHLGFCKEEFLPTNRGFDTHQGFWSGYETYYTKIVEDEAYNDYTGYNFVNGESVQFDANGTYSTHLYTQLAEKVITDHAQSNPGTPLFLYLAYQAPHSPLEVPQQYEDLYSNIENDDRRVFSAMVTAMDESIGNVTLALKDNGLYDNTIIVFLGDNGGDVGKPPHKSCGEVGPRPGAGNNFPLRGMKNTLFEGGVRTPGFVHSPLLQDQGMISNQLIHITDWLPTLYNLAGASSEEVEALDIDGVNQVDLILQASSGQSRRDGFVVNINENAEGKTQAALRDGKYKLIMNPPPRDGWIEPPTANGQLDEHHCKLPNTSLKTEVGGQMDKILLFDIESDPEEREDISDQFPDVVSEMVIKVSELKQEMIPADEPAWLERVGVEDGVWVTGWC